MQKGVHGARSFCADVFGDCAQAGNPRSTRHPSRARSTGEDPLCPFSLNSLDPSLFIFNFIESDFGTES
jgi:hypothetical protein